MHAPKGNTGDHFSKADSFSARLKLFYRRRLAVIFYGVGKEKLCVCGGRGGDSTHERGKIMVATAISFHF